MHDDRHPSRRPLVGGCALMLITLLPTAAHAHPGTGHAAGFLHGFAHPIAGLDHLLAMVTVGLWAAQRGGRAVWALPATFVGVMLAGGALGVTGVALVGGEAAIASSVLVLGTLVALAARPRPAFAAAIVAAAALVHGHAHGAEMPAAGAVSAYATGFATATALLHAVGAAAGLALVPRPGSAAEGPRVRRPLTVPPGPQLHLDGAAWVRFGGSAIALAGLALLLF